MLPKVFQGHRERPPEKSPRAVLPSSGDRIRTCDLWVMSPASYRAAPPRVGEHQVTEGARALPNRLLTSASVRKMPPNNGVSAGGHAGSRKLSRGAVLLHRIVEALQRLAVRGEVAALLGLAYTVERRLNLL